MQTPTQGGRYVRNADGTPVPREQAEAESKTRSKPQKKSTPSGGKAANTVTAGTTASKSGGNT